MSFKLAIKNIKKSVKDYSIYFFTLVMAVVIFYVFNSLESQSSMMILNESKYQIVQSLVMVLSYVSIFVSIILGFLIVYSNNFLIKRRKKEFGIYLTLGMSKRKVSTVLVLETLIVGILSLVMGLILGIVFSQILSVFTAKLFEVNMTAYKFIFSSASLIKTIIYFGLIFLLVMVFNVISLSKHKLIDLLTAKKKNEKVKFRNKYVIVISFILSLVLIIYAYKKLLGGAIVTLDNNVIKMLIAGALGTFLFFFSSSGFILKVFQLSKKAYYKNLNMFNIKQINSKINSSVVSTTVICLMLLLTICILSGSIALSNVYNGSLEENNKTDFTMLSYEYNCVVSENPEEGCKFNKNQTTISGVLNSKTFKESIKEYAYYNIYKDDSIVMSTLIDEESKRQLRKDYGDTLEIDSSISILSESDYNAILNLYREKNIDIKLDEYLLTANVEMAADLYEKLYLGGNILNINNKSLKPATDQIISVGLQNYSGSSNFGTIVVSDEIVEGLVSEQNNIIGNYLKNIKTESDEKKLFDSLRSEGYLFTTFTKIDMQNSSVGLKAILIFVGLYLGIIFAISSATVLAIGNLSESSDNKERYHVLKQIGADEKMIKKSLLIQILVSFAVPLVVALVHSFFGLKELNGIIKILGDIDLSSNILITSIFIIIIYGGYFMLTYVSSKNIIKSE